MATDTFYAGAINDNTSMIANFSNAYPPFVKNGGLEAKKFTKGTEYSSGNDLVVEVESIKKSEFAIFLDETGAILAYTEAASTNGTGIKFTLAAVTADYVQMLLIYSI